MRIRRLGWAGVEVSAHASSLVVDYIRDFPLLTATQPVGAYAAPQRPAAAALVTHLHEDHTDVAAIRTVLEPSGKLLRPRPFAGLPEEGVFVERNEQILAASELDVRVVDEWENVTLAPFDITAVPAVDGLGDPQTNWVIEADGQRIFHGGDTIFHGYWWLIARRVGPIDIAIMPVNGATVIAPHLDPPSSVPAVLTPELAVRAAHILGAKAMIPMHFGVHQPPLYVERPDPVAHARDAARSLPLHVLDVGPGDEVDVSEFAR